MKEVKETSTDSTDAPTDTEETNTDILPSKEQAASNKKKKNFFKIFLMKSFWHFNKYVTECFIKKYPTLGKWYDIQSHCQQYKCTWFCELKKIQMPVLKFSEMLSTEL